MRRHIDRRNLLKGIGAAGAAGMAGCTTNGNGNGNGNGGGGETPDTLIVIGYPESGVQLFKDYYSDFDTDIPILVTDGLKAPDMPSQVGNAMSNVSGTAPSPSGPGSEEFATLYQDAYDSEPGVFTAHTYDSSALLMLANAAAGANDGQAVRDAMPQVANPEGEEFTPSQLPEAVEAAAAGDDVNYQGASSSTNFDSNGDMAAVTYEIFSFSQDGVETQNTIDFGGNAEASTADYSGSDSGRSLKFGILLPSTGDLASVGQPMTQAGELAGDQVNDAGTFTVDYQTEDSQTDPQAGISAAESLVNAGYPAVNGPASSGVNLPVSKQVYVPNQTVGCSPSSTTPTVTTLEDDGYVFRTAPSDALQGQVMGQIAYDDKGARTAATLYVNNDYGQALSQSFADAFEQKGGSVTNQVAFEKQQSSYTSPLEQVLN